MDLQRYCGRGSSLAGEFSSLSLGDEVFIDLRWIDLHLRRGDTDLAIAVIGSARERALRANSPEMLFLVDAWEAAFWVRLGDLDRALAKAYTAALETRDRPILSLVAVNTAALAEAYGRHHESAVLLGAAARLRGAHDRTDRQVRELTRRGRTALGEAFAAAYGKGWELDGKTAVTEVDPARLCRELGTTHPDPE